VLVILGSRQSSDGEPSLPQIALSKQSQQVARDQNHKRCAKPSAGAATFSPTFVAVVSCASGEQQHHNNDETDQHLAFLFTPGIPGCDLLSIAPSVSRSTIRRRPF